MKVVARKTSIGPDVINVQLTTWKIAIDRWRDLEHRFKDQPCDDDRFLEEAFVILVLAGTSVSQLLGQNTRINTKKNWIPKFDEMVDEQITDANLQSTLKEFNQIYMDLRHFGEPKHAIISEIDGNDFRRWMLALQQLWIEIGKPDASQIDEFDNTFSVEWIELDSPIES